MTNQIRFGIVSESVLDGPAWADHARRAEDAGVASLLIRDHFTAGAFGQQLAPFGALAAAAAVTSRLHVGTLVLSNDFRHPAIVAHEAAACITCRAAVSSSASGRAGTSPNTARRGSRSTARASGSTGSRSPSRSSPDCWPATGWITPAPGTTSTGWRLT